MVYNKKRKKNFSLFKNIHMSKKKVIIFCINGLGLGNSTRCLSIIECLKKIDNSLRIIVFTSGNGYFFFKKNRLIEKVYSQKQINYSKKNGKLNALNTFFRLPSFYKVFNHNTNKILNLEKKYDADLIFTDSFYFLPYLKKKIKCKLISLNNANEVVRSFFNSKIKKTFTIFPQFFFIELFDYLFHYFFSDVIISPFFNGKNKMINKKVFNCTPIVRNKLLVNNSKKFRPIIMLSGSSFSSKIKFEKKFYNKFKTLTVIGKKQKNSLKRLKFLGKKKNNIKLLNSYNSGIINAGFSAVSEFYLLKKPCVVIPVKGHSEQYFNAKMIENLGLGICSDEKSMFSDLSLIKNNFNTFSGMYKKVKDKNSNYKVAKFILKNI
tara:strand:- start:52492 stop:53625 length:1134 start_codon:yes stop_codon:yes gene_type:complete